MVTRYLKFSKSMNITSIELKKLKELYRNELGMEVSDKEAIKHAEQLINLLKITYRPDSPSSD